MSVKSPLNSPGIVRYGTIFAGYFLVLKFCQKSFQKCAAYCDVYHIRRRFYIHWKALAESFPMCVTSPLNSPGIVRYGAIFVRYIFGSYNFVKKVSKNVLHIGTCTTLDDVFTFIGKLSARAVQ